ncbi:MAG: hypothetical protein KDK55_01160 [Chlamydiia bacterium]|nr:hypothetical protein [Chlamydiia bacterium]
MHFTREPIIETIISAREGHKLILRNSKRGSQEEFVIDSVEVISFGGVCLFRSQEKPKPFLIPINDYEILETREARMVLKGVGIEKGIKIAGGKEAVIKTPKGEEKEEGYSEKKRERRRTRKKRGESRRETLHDEKGKLSSGQENGSSEPEVSIGKERPASALIPPPTTLISETLARYKETPIYAGAFFQGENTKTALSTSSKDSIVLDEQEEREEPRLHQEMQTPFEPESAKQHITDTDEELPF